MQERKRTEKNKPLPEIHSSVTEVLVANGRAFQPFIRTFRYTGENVSKANLGTLLGVFEIDDQSEDSAYIVNFLASVAKKEYFNNPRRGAIESFEAALHKINLALAELVKHGNVTWLGKFHGALGILEKNNLHFSVSGQATILLFRNGTIADISDGLASDESHIHPIKTFVEVSSGRLSTNDQVLLSTPELPALFGLEDLNKHAVRLGNERFTQFLKTALVNELDMAGLMVIDVTEGVPSQDETTTEKKAATPKPVRVNNVFSQSAFTPKKPDETPSINEVLIAKQTEQEAEYIDSKTGHIYVQGEAPEAPGQHPFFENWTTKLQELPHVATSFFRFLGKHLRRTKKQTTLLAGTIGEEGQALGKKMTRALRRQIRKYQEEKARKDEEKRLQTEAQAALALEAEALNPVEETPKKVIQISDIPKPEGVIPQQEIFLQDEPAPLPLDQTETDTPLHHEGKTELPMFMKEKLAQFYQRKTAEVKTASVETEPDQTKTSSALASTTLFFAQTSKEISSRSKALLDWLVQALRTTKERFGQVIQNITPLIQKHATPRVLLALGGIALVLIGVAVWYFFAPHTTPQTEVVAPETVVPSTINTPSQIAPATSGEMTLILNNLSDTIVASVILDDQVYVVTEKNIIAVAENKTFPLPSGMQAKFATAMDDLRLIFVYTENGKLYAWSPIARSFFENTLPLEGNVAVAGIDTYLTYLYVLDSATDQVFRFPRADGGFGTGTSWLKETLAIEADARLTVNETLFIGLDESTVKAFFRGRSGNTFELPTGGLTLADIYTHPGLTNVYGLDASHKRILIWNQDGRLIKEISHDKLSDGTTLSVNEKQGEFFISTEEALLSYKLR